MSVPILVAIALSTLPSERRLVDRVAAVVNDEIITFSERADKTPGSTSDVKAGEKLPVRELMYGMMLPSGNDATVAFAGWENDRLCARQRDQQRRHLGKSDKPDKNAEAAGVGGKRQRR